MDAVCRRLAARAGAVNPFDYLESPRAQASIPRYLTRNTAQAVVQWVARRRWSSEFERLRNTAIVALMLLSGLRRQETIRLSLDDVRDDEGTILIQRGKGRFGGRDRMAYMTPQLRAILRAYTQERRRRKSTSDAYLLATDRDAGISVITIRRLFARITRALGTRVTPHMLRHTYATLLRQAGVPDRVSMDLLGHKSVAMLQRYSHVVDGEHLQEAARLRIDLDIG
jgi:integrase/recombinase XerD